MRAVKMDKSTIGLFLLMIMSIDIFADSLADSLSMGQYNGNIRLGYQNQKTVYDSRSEFAAGINLHYETAAFYGLQLGTTLFTSQGNGQESFEGVPFFDENNQNYAIVGEAYLKGLSGNTSFIFGRQELETPFADSDDLGMVPNRFEAYTFVNTDIKDTTLFFSQVQQWAGVDSDVQSAFIKVNGDSGMQIFGMTYEGLSDTTLSGWFYNLKDEVKITYLEAAYALGTESYTYGAIAQVAFQDYDNQESSKIYGVSASFGLRSIGLTTTIAYNNTKGIAADNFFGGGPFVTSAEHNTIKEAGPDGNIILYTFEWNAAMLGEDNLTFIANIDAHHKDLFYAKEYDLSMAYTYSKSMNFRAVYSDVNDKAQQFKNFRMFANYMF
jgi:hypothetical protein